MSATAQRACAYCGFGLVVLFFTGYGAIAGFLIPPSPNESAVQIAQMYADHKTAIRLGMLISLYSAGLLVPWAASLFIQLRRAEGGSSPLPYVVVLGGTLFSMEFIYLIMFYQTAAFRQDISPEITRALNDMGWIPFVGLTSTAVVMCVALGCSMLSDRREVPVFPRWAGYFNLWVAFMFTPGSLCVFFKDGPFAYNGVLAWYVPVAVFTIWMPLNSVLVLRAIRRQQNEHATLDHAHAHTDVDVPTDVEGLAVEFAQMRQELARISAAGSTTP